MKPFKIAAALLAVFCVMHTVGGMLLEESVGAEADAVFGRGEGNERGRRAVAAT